jgi:hypothetical protein
MTLNEHIDAYFNLQAKIYEGFGYHEGWVVIPMSDLRNNYWMIVGKEDDGKLVRSPDPLTTESIKAGVNIYTSTIYTQRFLPKWVYRANGLVMVCENTHCDGNKFLSIFSSDRECTDQKLKDTYKERWGHL